METHYATKWHSAQVLFSRLLNSDFRQDRSMSLGGHKIAQNFRLAMPGGSEPGKDESQSIFIREIKPDKKKPFLQMVVTRRSGSKLTFSAAWRLYSELTSWDSTMSPLDLLYKFVDRYGIPFSIFNIPPTKFLFSESIDMPVNSINNFELRVFGQEQNVSKNFMAQVSVKYDDNRHKLLLSLGYVIDAKPP